MFEPMFEKLTKLCKGIEDYNNTLHHVNELYLLIWSGDMAMMYEYKVLIYAVAISEGQENIIGYCNPEGFWYLCDDKLCLCKWNQMFNELAEHELKVFMASNKNTSIDLTGLRTEFERVISLVSMTNMYEIRLVESVERMKNGVNL